MEDYHSKISGYSAAATVFLLFLVSGLIVPALSGMSWAHIILSGVLAAAVSYGTYEFILKFINARLKRTRWVREFILGHEYLEGTWVGFADQYEGARQFTVEYFDQSDGRLVIEGYMYDQNMYLLGRWWSQTTHIDTRNRKLFYAYNCDMNHSSSSHEGVANFTLVRGSKGNEVNELLGYAADLTNSTKDANNERRIAKTRLEPKEAVRQAKELYSN